MAGRRRCGARSHPDIKVLASRHQVSGQDSLLDRAAAAADRRSFDFFVAAANIGSSASTVTVLVAFLVNVLVAAAKSVAAALTGSASMLAEAARSWADAGNEIFLVIANRRARRPPDAAHPLGHGREAYVWSLFAALGLLVAGGAISIMRGVQHC